MYGYLRMSLASLFLLTALAGAQVSVTTFDGIDASQFTGATLGVDPNGSVGTVQYMEWADHVYQGFNKSTHALVYPSGPVQGDTPWRDNNMPDCYGGNGNVQLNFDRMAKRWVIGRRQIQTTGNAKSYFYCIAVSNTDDLTAGNFMWYTYELALDPVLGLNQAGATYFPDYPKIGTWADGYYVSIDVEDPSNGFNEVGIVACAFDRTTMLTGGTMRTPQCVEYPGPPNERAVFLAHSLEPADIDGTTAPPVGAPEYFVSLENPSAGQTTANFVNAWVFHVDWSNPANSTFTTPPMHINVPSYTQGCLDLSNEYDTLCVPEPSSAQTGVFIDSVGDRLMQRLAYRRFPAYQSWLVSGAVQVGSAPLSKTGIRWYEYRDKGASNSGTISYKDSNYRFMPSIAQDKAANMAVGYSVSGATVHPSIAASYLNLQSHTAPTEITLLAGSGDEENSYHWGVYSSMTVDPTDDCTFWYVNEEFPANQIGSQVIWHTAISYFKLPGC